MSQFDFLQREWPAEFDACGKAEAAVHTDPRTACFYARRALELAVNWLYKYESRLKLPYQENLSALIHDSTFKRVTGEAVFNKARVIVSVGNRAVHSLREIPTDDALVAVGELFHVAYWLARTYGAAQRPPPDLKFDSARLSKAGPTRKQTAEQLQRLEKQLQEKDEKLTAFLADKTALDDELKRLRAQVAEARKAADAQPDTHDYSEAQTRDYFIDLLLKEAGWALDQDRDREFPVIGMPNQKGEGFVNYVLWGDDGKPLALVEAKRTRRDPRVGQQQARLYADCIEKQFGQRPLIFYSNGYDHWLWDDARYPPHQVQGFFKKSELELAIQRRTSRKPLATTHISKAIVERFYQTRAIRRIAEILEQDNDRKALLVMATGAGKTRTVAALCELLMRCNWVKRVLFLTDRVALVNQAVGVFKQFLPDSSPVNLVTQRDGEGRVFVSTYPTLMGLIEHTRDGQRRFGNGHFDLIIIDEAHRSIFQKYRAIFEYFDSLLVGLTATPKEEIDRNTYGLFDLENGVPTDSYSLEEAVRDRFLVPLQAVSVPLKFQREGIKYNELSEDERDQWDAIEWDEDGNIPHQVEAAAINKWLFNVDTVNKVLQHLVMRGLPVAGGDRLGKTIIFAKNQSHAEFIEERFNVNYPHLKGEFARVITFKTEYAQSLIDAFSSREKPPHIAISVDMLDTGIDISEVVNLVFFKLVRSKTKFWQMIGRGTRLCPDLFGPGQDKQFFYVFDFCQNLEYFSQNPTTTEGASGASLGKRLFVTRLNLIGELDEQSHAGPPAGPEGDPAIADPQVTDYSGPKTNAEVRADVGARLHSEVAAMNLDNFVVRPHRRTVEKFAKPEAWKTLSSEDCSELARQVAGLPTALESEPEEAKRFDLLLLNLQLALLRAEPGYVRLQTQVRDIAGLLEEKSAIPAVQDQMDLILDIQADEWWQDITVPLLERARRRLRDLVRLIDKQKRKPIYTDFEDLLGGETPIILPAFADAANDARFRAKALAFLRAHEDHIAIEKLRRNRPLTKSDLTELERMLIANGVGGPKELDRAKTESHGLGLFVRSLIGLDRESAKEAFGAFLTGKTLSANQIEFINLIINHLTEHGIMEPAALYESPFTDLTPSGPEGLFNEAQINELISVLATVRDRAAA